MHADEIRHLFEYAHWVTRTLLAAAAQLPDEVFALDRALVRGGRGLRYTLAHELESEESWRLSVNGTSFEQLRDVIPTDYARLDELAAEFAREHAEMDGWLSSLTDEAVAAIVTPSISGHPRPLWQYLLHVVFHTTQQNADAAMLLSAAGASPGNIDYGSWLQSTERDSE